MQRGCCPPPISRHRRPKAQGEDTSISNGLRANQAESPEDIQATLCELTARSIADAVQTHLPTVKEVGIRGGGGYNSAPLERLKANLPDSTVISTAAWVLEPQ